jgi:hypothetical protein
MGRGTLASVARSWVRFLPVTGVRDGECPSRFPFPLPAGTGADRKGNEVLTAARVGSRVEFF